jgi:hypothetical protein
MGKDLHYSILPFLERALSQHEMVSSFNKVETEEEIFYEIERIGKKSLKIWVSDAYRFNLVDYYLKPEGIDFIYVAKPEAWYDTDDVVQNALKDGINIGLFGALMGVLYVDNIKDYIPKERRD